MRLVEARRIAAICAVCNYCNGFCEAFRALERRSERREPSSRTPLSDGDLISIAHLCHNCGNCLTACQYAPPHPFAVNVPRTFAEVRRQSWRERPWLSLIGIVAVPLLTLAFVPWDVLFQRHAGSGAFYAVIGWSTLVMAVSVPLAFSVAVLAFDLRRFWRETGKTSRRGFVDEAASAALALNDALTLRNLKGGGLDCEQGRARRLFHHALVLGFLLCFAATLVATAYHHAFGWLAPYPFVSLPVLLGTAGGIGMIAGSAGLAYLKFKADPELDATPKHYSFLALLFTVAFTGLVLLLLRDTKAMGLLLATHLGAVIGLFVTFPYGKFVHAPYRVAVLLRAAMERRA